MKKSEKIKKIAHVILDVSNDFLNDKITEERYLALLKVCRKNIKNLKKGKITIY